MKVRWVLKGGDARWDSNSYWGQADSSGRRYTHGHYTGGAMFATRAEAEAEAARLVAAWGRTGVAVRAFVKARRVP